MNTNLEIHTFSHTGKAKSGWFNRSFSDISNGSNERKHCDKTIENGGIVMMVGENLTSASVTKTIQYLQDLNNKLIGQGK